MHKQNHIQITFYGFALLSGVFLFSSCEQNRELRTYQERISETSEIVAKLSSRELPAGHPPINQGTMNTSGDPELQEIINNSVINVALIWNTPESWQEEKGNGMRLASFTNSDNSSMLCTIISLSGAAGGISANVRRWLGQIGLDQLPSNDIATFLDNLREDASRGGLIFTLIDFTPLQKKNSREQDPSMIAAIYEVQGKTIFVKMTGSLKAVRENIQEFKELCQSLRLNDE